MCIRWPGDGTDQRIGSKLLHPSIEDAAFPKTFTGPGPIGQFPGI